MKAFTGYQYLMIDVANQFGLDKENFEPRIQWVLDNMDDLENLMPKADEPILYIKAVDALRDAQQGIPTGHMMGLDACASGPQLMGVITGCEETCRNTGLIDPDNRVDLYKRVTETQNSMLNQGDAVTGITRSAVKDATMPFFYGSKAKPKEIFGEDTPQYKAFFKALQQITPGAYKLMEELLDAWQPYTLVHEWDLPDGFHARVKVMEATDKRVEVDELNHATFTHRFYENKGSKSGLSVAANVVHSIDAMVVREMNRRCNYDKEQLTRASEVLSDICFPLQYEGETIEHRENFISLNMVDELLEEGEHTFSTNDLLRLQELVEETLSRKSFPIVCVHDEFKASPNNMNILRKTYIDILAELADSNIIQDTLNQIHGTTDGVYKKLSNDLSTKIRKSNYGLS